MKHLLIIPLAFLILALPVLAQEPTEMPTSAPGTTNTGTIPEVKPTPEPLPPVDKPSTAPKPTPGVPSNIQQQRQELMKENMEQRQEFRQGVASTTKANLMERKQLPPGQGGVPGMMGSTTKGIIMERKDLFLENQAQRKEFRQEIGSSTKQAIMERREGFASTTKALVMERRAIFASSTSAKILEMRENKEERREHFASTSALRKAEFTEEMKGRVLLHAEHAAELLDAMLGRLAGIAERINARIEQLSAEGVEVAFAEAELAEAYDAIDDAELAIEAVKAGIASALESETPREMMAEAKALGDTAKQALRTAHEALREAAQALPKAPQPEATNI